MARTDKTRPFRVKMVDSPSNYKAVHHHEDGSCDLPAPPTGQWSDGRPRTTCHWTHTDTWLGAGDKFCGCRMCTNHWGRRWDRRNDRHRAQRECRDALRAGDTLH